MKLAAAAAIGALAVFAAPATAQPAPHGSYLRNCRNVLMKGQFLSAYCQGSQGSAQSQIDVAGCSTDIGVAPDGGLVCRGPGVADPAPPRRAATGSAATGSAAWPPPGGGPPRSGYNRWSATIFERASFRGRAFRVQGEMPNLASTGFDDQVASIRLDRRTGPWLVCTDADFRGRCVTVSRDISDTGYIGMANAISSIRPLR